MPEEGYTLKDEDNRTIDMSDGFSAFLIDYLKNRKSGEFVLRPEKAQGTWKYRYDCSIDVTPFCSHNRRVFRILRLRH